MNKVIVRASLALCFCTSVGPAFAAAAVHTAYLETPSDTLASSATKSLYTYLATRRGAANSGNRMVEGQHLGGLNEINEFGVGTLVLDYDDHLISGKLPGMVGSRYDSDMKFDLNGNPVAKVNGMYPYVLDEPNCTNINDELITIYNAALPGTPPIIHITAVARNPWDQTYGRDPSPSDGDLVNLLHATNLAGNQAAIDVRNRFWADIDIIAAALQQLEDAGIPVVFRPFAEFNQPNKYYCKDKVDTQFVALWHDVFNYYTSDSKKGLHNLLFCWEVWVLNRQNGYENISSWYPGTDVDIVAGSYYFDYQKTYLTAGVFSLPATDVGANQNDDDVHNFLVSQNRPFGAAQWGLAYGMPTEVDGIYGDHAFTLAFMDYCPDMGFVYYWKGNMAVENQSNATTFVADSKVTTVDELPKAVFISNSPTTQDGWVLESTSSSNAGGSINANDTANGGKSALMTGDDTGKKQYKSILSFDTSAIPSTATVDSVTLKVKRAMLSGSMTGMGTATVEMKTGSFNSTVALDNADFQAACNPANTAVASGVSLPAYNDKVLSASLSAAGCAAINKGSGAKTQFRIFLSVANDTDSVADFIGWYSGEAEIDNGPVLEIKYH